MAQILADAKMTKQIQEATGPVAVVNDQGTMIGYCMPMSSTCPPYTPEELASRRAELERRRQEARKYPETGKSLVEVMAYLHSLTGEKS